MRAVAVFAVLVAAVAVTSSDMCCLLTCLLAALAIVPDFDVELEVEAAAAAAVLP